ncbi:MAG: hypothetical protein Q3979_04210 [Actinomycetaceae bacterium]|nr:hypothetical protein [Actinomycetaceae bacterium]
MKALLGMHARTGRTALAGWPLAWAAMVVAVAASTMSLHSTAADRARYAATVGMSRVQEAFNGRAWDVDTPGGIASFEIGFAGLLLIPIGAFLMAVGRTRKEESQGRWDIVTAGSFTRTAPVASAGIAASAAVAVFFALAAVGLAGLGLPLRGSIAYAGVLACLALFFAWLGLLVAQIVSEPSTATTVGLVGILCCFVVRAVVDVRHSGATWLTPMGWMGQARPWSDVRWWPYVAFALSTALVAALSLRLAALRDLGSGLLPARPGPAFASRYLSSVDGWVWRVVRGNVAGWKIGGIVLASVMGSFAREVTRTFEDNPSLMSLLEDFAPEDFLTVFVMLILALMAMAAGLSVWSHHRAEEVSGRLGRVAAGVVRPSRLWDSWMLCSVASAAIVMTAGIVFYCTCLFLAVSDARVGSAAQFGLVLLVAVVFLVCLGGLLVARFPRWWPLAWVAFAWIAAEAMLVGGLDLPEWLRDTSPLHAVGQLDDPQWTVVGALVLASGALVGVGHASKRDLLAG